MLLLVLLLKLFFTAVDVFGIFTVARTSVDAFTVVGIAAIACVSSAVNIPFPLVLAMRLLLESPDVPVLHLVLLLSRVSALAEQMD